MNQPIFSPSIFLSHSSADKPAAIELKRRILASPAAKQAGLTVWLDKDDLVPSSVQWQAQIEQAIAEATCFAIYLGSGGVINWVENEVRVAISRAVADKSFVIVPIVDANATRLGLLPAFAREYQAVRDPLNDEAALAALIGAAITPSSRSKRDVVLVDHPFVGLQTMTEAEADLFFGREEEVSQLVEIFAKDNLAAIVADSGSGKSSLAQAGFIPAFRGAVPSGNQFRDRDQRIRHVVIVRPGNDPLEGLRLGVTHAAEQLGRSDEQRNFYRSKLDFADPNETAIQMQCGLPAGGTLTLLVVDQFEEALTGHRENSDFGDFLNALAERQDFCVLITIRQDYFNLLQRFQQVYSRLQANEGAQILRLKRISEKGLAEIVRRPLTKAGYRPDDPEVEALISAVRKDMSDRPGDLTLVQATLDAVWRKRQTAGGLLEAYASVGGVAGALANEAEMTRSILDDEEQKYLLPVLVRLIRPGETAGATRRVALLSEFSDASRKLVQKLAGPRTKGGERLAPLLFVGDHVEIAHEALITQWGWLQSSLQSVWPDLRRLHRLIDKAALWMAAEGTRKPQHLATGAEREEYNDLRRNHPDWLSSGEIEFVDASQKAFDDSEAAARKQADDRVRQNRKLRLLALGLGVGAAALVVALITNVVSNNKLSAATAKAEQRSALLAANVAKGLAEDGSVDQALLLLLSGSNLFDDRNAPDEVLIGFDAALRKKSGTETFELSRPVTVFEGKLALYLFDPASKDILKVVNKVEPVVIFKGRSADLPILKMTESRDGKSLFLVRTDLAVEAINLATGAIRRAGQFKKTSKNEEADVLLTADGLAVRNVYGEGTGNVPKALLQLIDANSGAVFEGLSPIESLTVASSAGGGTYFLETDKPNAYRVNYGQRLSLQQVTLTEAMKSQIYYEGCALQVKDSAALFKKIHKLASDNSNNDEAKCRKFGDKFLVTATQGTSAGEVRTDNIVNPDADASDDVRNLVENASRLRLSRNNLSWVGLSPDGGFIGVISNRDVVVVNDEGDTIMSYRHPAGPSSARFVGSDTLLVVEDATGTIVAHDLRPGRGVRYLPAPAAAPLLQENSKYMVQPLHFGNCDGVSNNISKERTLLGGYTIAFGETDGTQNTALRSFLNVASGRETYRIDIPENACVQFSPDSQQVVLHDQTERTAQLYDTRDLLSSKSFGRANAVKLPIESPASVRFSGSAGGLILTNYSESVLELQKSGDRWETREIYRGQNPITFADLDDLGSRLIVIENAGTADMYGYLYSLKARQKWMDLGRDYKFLDAVFFPGGEIGISKHGVWSSVYSFASFSNMVAQAKLALSPRCRPAEEGVFRSSPCWPAGLE